LLANAIAKNNNIKGITINNIEMKQTPFAEEEEEEDLFSKQNMYTNDKAIMAHSQVKYI